MVKDKLVGKRILFIGEAPGPDEVKQGEPFVGRAGKKLKEIINFVGIPLEDISFANIVHCFPGRDGDGRIKTPEREEIISCSNLINTTLYQLNPTYLVPLGNISTEYILRKKGVKITKIAGEIFRENGRIIIPLPHPSYIVQNPSEEQRYKILFQRVKNLIYQTEEVYPDRYELIFNGDSSKLDIIAERIGMTEKIIVDVETTGLDLISEKTRLLSVGIGANSEEGIVMDWSINNGGKEKIKNWMGDSEIGKIGQNIKFDILALKRLADIKTAGRLDDIMLAHYLVTGMVEGKEHSHRLKKVASEYGIPISMIKEIDYKNIANLSKQELLEYNKSDVILAALLHEKIPKVQPAYDFLCKSISTLVNIEIGGLNIDNKYVNDVLSPQAIEKYNRLKTQVIKLSGNPNFNPSSPLQISKLLISKGVKLPLTDKGNLSTRIEILETIDNPICKLLIEYSRIEKLLSTYIEPYRDKIKVYPTYNLHMTDTGRLSSDSPNVQNIPTNKTARLSRLSSFRKMFKAPEGYKIVAVDYSQIEPKIMALLAGEYELLIAEDVYRDMFLKCYKKPPPSKDDRDDFKQIILGVMYGLAKEEVAKPFFNTFPKIAQWQREQKKNGLKTGKAEVPYTGRWRKLEGRDIGRLERLSVNTKIQSLASDVTLNTANNIYNKFNPEEVRLCNLVHDELVSYVLFDSKFNERVKQLKEIAQESPKGFILDLKINLKVDVEIGDNWGELMPWKDSQ